MELLAKIVDDFHPLSIIAKSSFVDIWKGSQYTCYNSKNSFRKKPVMESILAHSKSADLLKQIPSQNKNNQFRSYIGDCNEVM